MFRQLNRKCAYATGTRLNENFLPFLQIGFFNQCLPGGQANQRDGSRFFHAEVLWLNRHGIFLQSNEFRESTDSVVIWPRIDLIADLKSPRERSDSNHDTSHIIAQN